MKDAIRALANEVWQGMPPGQSGTWFVQGNEALQSTLDAITAEMASTRPAGGVSTVAAHVLHMTYYLNQTLGEYRGQQEPSDWAGSWKVQEVTPTEWEAAKATLQERIAQFNDLLEGQNLGDLDERTYALANVAHLGYHLGAIRQIYLILCSRGG